MSRSTATDAGAPKRLIAYTRVSKADRTREDSLGIEAQRATILAAAERNGWEIVGWYTDDGISGKSVRRTGLQTALMHLRRRKTRAADGLVAAKLDRLSRSVMDFGNLLEQSRRAHFGLIVLDFDLDTTTATGRLIAGMLMQVAQWEREMIGERTKAALAIRKAEGVQLGKPSTIPPAIQAQIIQRHHAGDSLSAIARQLNASAVPTPSGSGTWSHTVVGGVVRRWSIEPLAVTA